MFLCSSILNDFKFPEQIYVQSYFHFFIPLASSGALTNPPESDFFFKAFSSSFSSSSCQGAGLVVVGSISWSAGDAAAHTGLGEPPCLSAARHY